MFGVGKSGGWIRDESKIANTSVARKKSFGEDLEVVVAQKRIGS